MLFVFRLAVPVCCRSLMLLLLTLGMAEFISLQGAARFVGFPGDGSGNSFGGASYNGQNSGEGMVTFTSLKAGGVDYASFLSSATSCGSSLAAGASCTISVVFKPEAVRTYAATFNVSDNATGSPQSVKLSGSGK